MVLINRDDVLSLYKANEAGLKALEKYSYLFPLKASTILAGIIGDLFSDGHLQGNPKWRFDFTSNSIQELKRFENEVYTIFVIKGSIRKCVTNKYSSTFNYGVNNKPISRILFLCGTPAGNKVLQPLKVPGWILENKLMFRRFIQRVFDCEGTLDVDNKYIELCMYKAHGLMSNGYDFFNSIRTKLFEYFKIETTKAFTEKRSNLRKDGIKTKAIKFKIKKKDSVIKFYKYIGFENNKKHRKLKVIIRSIRAGQ